MIETWKEAANIVDGLKERLTDKVRPDDESTVKLFDAHGNEIPWVGLNYSAGTDAAWDRLAIANAAAMDGDKFDTKVPTDYNRGPFVILVCHFPAGSLKDPDMTKIVYTRVNEIRPI